MERYIGLDVHAASTTFAVIGESGKRLGTHVVETNGQALVEQLKTIAGKKHVCLEEGTQSAWIYEILSPHAEEVIVAAIPESRGQKSDERDAFGLAEQLRTGAIKRHVFKEVGDYKKLRELGRTHAMVVQDVVRAQNRIKALLRSRGVAVSDKSVYSKRGREAYLKKLPDASRGAAGTLFAQYDAVEAIRRQAEKDLGHEAHRFPISRVLEVRLSPDQSFERVPGFITRPFKRLYVELADLGWFTVDALPPVPPRLSIARAMIDDWVRRMGGDPDRLDEARVERG